MWHRNYSGILCWFVMYVVEKRKSSSIRRLKEKVILPHSSTMDASGDSETHFTAPATEIEHAYRTSIPTCPSTSIKCAMQSGRSTSTEERIERSKCHWSQLSEFDSDDGEVAEESNVQVFKALETRQTCEDFLLTFSEDEGRTLVVGEKFAEGGQAELYHVLDIKWLNEWNNELNKILGLKWVLKVFKKGTFLRQLQHTWPPGMFHPDEVRRSLPDYGENKRLRLSVVCRINHGLLLEDGRFAFLMGKEDEDLQNLIDRNMTMRTTQDHGPFSEDVATTIMYSVALGMEWLHRHNIVHRDLKASNILLTNYEDKRGTAYYVADYESSIGVIGTGFFRAPEILQACKDKTIHQRPELFTKEADVYSYGMICYEILTGKFPFEDHSLTNYDLVLNGQCPEIPEYVDDWMRNLLSKCWHPNPAARPSFGEILNLFVANSIATFIDFRERGKIASTSDKMLFTW